MYKLSSHKVSLYIISHNHINMLKKNKRDCHKTPKLNMLFEYVKTFKQAAIKL